MGFTVVVLEASKSNAPIPRGPSSPGKRAHVLKKESGGDGGNGGVFYTRTSHAQF